MANETIQDLTAKGSATSTTDLFETEVQVSPGVYVSRKVTGQNIFDGIIAVIGPINFQGTWNAATNTPTLTSSVGTKGYAYIVNVAGTTNLDGIDEWAVGDWAVFNGSVWQKVDNSVGLQVISRWVSFSGAGMQALAPGFGWISDSAGTSTYEFSATPGTYPEGTVMGVSGGSATGWSIAVQNGQAVFIGNQSYIGPTTITSNNANDVITFLCIDPDSVFLGYTANNAALIGSGYTPTNYTPTNDTVAGNLEGINTALASLANIFELQSITTGGTHTLVKGKGFIANTGATMITALPVTANAGDYYMIVGGSDSGWSIDINPGQSLRVGPANYLGASTFSSTSNTDSLFVYCRTTNTAFEAVMVNTGAMLRTGYNPVNYLDSTLTVASALEGIDNKLAVASNSVIISPVSTNAPFNTITLNTGQVVGGETGQPPLATTLAAGSNVTIDSSTPGTITISATGGSGGSLTWSHVSLAMSPIVMSNNEGYITDGVDVVEFILPASADQDFITAVRGGTAPGFKIYNNAGQNIQFGTVNSGIGGNSYIQSTSPSDQVFIGNTIDDLNFYCYNSQGNLEIVTSLGTSDFPGLLTLYDARDLNDGSPLPADGDPIATWFDLSGNNNDLENAVGGEQPLFVLNAFNGNPGVHFDGVDDSLLNTTISNSTSSFYALMVCTRNAWDTMCHGYISCYSNSESNDFDNVSSFGTSSCFSDSIEVARSGLTSFDMETITNDTPFIVGFFFDGSQCYGKILNGSPIIQSISSSFAQNRLLMGARWVSSAPGFFGDITMSYCVTGNGTLTEFELNGLMLALANEFGVPVL